jgi:hypothetical protein
VRTKSSHVAGPCTADRVGRLLSHGQNFDDAVQDLDAARARLLSAGDTDDGRETAAVCRRVPVSGVKSASLPVVRRLTCGGPATALRRRASAVEERQGEVSRVRTW